MPSVFKNYLSLVKFSHTIFAFPFAAIGFAIGISENPDALNIKLLLLVMLCMVTARSAAMAFNRLVDKEYDKMNPRTMKREIPNQIIKPSNALLFTIANCIVFVVATFFINKLVFFLSPIALFVILGYSYTKRFTFLCHLILGLGLALAPIGAYLSVTERFALLPILFSLSVLFWVSGFDIIYSLQDKDFDKKQQLFSIPVALGNKNAIWLSRLLHIISSILLLTAGYLGGYGLLYFVGLSFFIFLLVYQHFLIKPDDFSKLNLAFATVNGIASVLFAVFVLLDFIL